MKKAVLTDFQDLLEAEGGSEVAEQLNAGIEAAQHEQAAIDKTVKGYEMRLDGLYKLAAENKQTEKVCSAFRIAGQARTFDSQSWSKVIELTNSDNKTERVVIKNGDLMSRGDETVQELVNLGLQIESLYASKHIKDFILKYKPKNKIRLTERTGFHNIAGTSDQVFLLGSECIGQATEEVIQMGLPHGSPSLKRAGSLEQWKREISVFAEGQTRMTLAISTAFAATMLRPLNLEGAIVGLFGSSSKGKTTLLNVASSVVGGPAKDYVKSFRSTVNGLEGLCAASTDILLCLDELATLRAEDAADAVYMITANNGKTRAGKDGEARKSKKWLCLALTNGEIPIATHIKDSGKQLRAGHEVRALDIHAIASSEYGVFDHLPEGFATSFDFVKHLEKALKENYGEPIRPFIEYTLANGKALAARFEEERRYLTSLMPEKASSQVRRVADRFALISLAGTVATELGLTGWGSDNARKCIVSIMNEWLSERSAGDDSESRKVIQAIQDFISKNESRFTPINQDNSYATSFTTHNRAGFMKLSGESGKVECWYFIGSVFNSEVLAGISRKAAGTILKRGKFLQHGNTSYQLEAGGKLQPRVVPILNSIMEGSA
jgi:putative DNA primase/helicase